MQTSTTGEDAPKPPTRPLPVTIVAILILIGSIGAIFAGTVTYSNRETFISIVNNETTTAGLGTIGANEVNNFAFILIGYGILHLAIAYGLWTGQEWSRRVSLLLSTLGLLGFLPAVLALPEVALPVVIFASLVLYYFTRARVKEFFS